jgi:hypothetical protein
MTKAEAIQQIRDAARGIVPLMMKIHPAVQKLEDAEVQAEIFKHLHQLTTELEAIKKKVARLESKDDSSLL